MCTDLVFSLENKLYNFLHTQKKGLIQFVISCNLKNYRKIQRIYFNFFIFTFCSEHKTLSNQERKYKETQQYMFLRTSTVMI